MGCREREFIGAFVAGELPPEGVVGLEVHLETCEACFALVGDALAKLPPVAHESVPAARQSHSRLSLLLLSRFGRSSDTTPVHEVESGRSTKGATFGPYRITGLLGQGGMGVVYRAHHARTGRAVALKAVKAPMLTTFAGLRQEIEFLSQARHPGVVEVLDADLFSGDPWYAMELLEGQTLADWNIENWGDGPFVPALPAANGKLDVVLNLFVDICEPLAFIHGAGIIHGDLKPSNVFLRDGLRPVLVDFGLGTRARGTVGREALDVRGRARGTLPYIPPESIRGQIPDARADIYSLGCMLYEGVTGVPPFVADTNADVFDMHLSVDPVPASQRVSGVPPALDDLLTRVLAKTRASRIGHAADVAAWLRDIVSALQPGSSPGHARPGTPPRTHLFRPPIVGRSADMARLNPHISGAENHGRGGMIMVSGESGIGKTFLASELSQQASLLGMRVVLGECNPRSPTTSNHTASGNAPLMPFRRVFEAIRDRCREIGEAETARLIGPHLAVLATYFPALSSLGDVPPPSSLPSMAARERTIAAVTEVIASFAQQRRLLIAIDDLQWADDLSLAVLQQLDEGYFRDAPLVILGTYRSDEASDLLTALSDKPGVVNCRLQRLESADIGAMIVGMLGMHDAPSAMLTYVYRQAEGIPFFAAEYLRMLADHGMLVRRHGSWSLVSGASFEQWEARKLLPASLSDLVANRIEQLGEHALVVAQAAAVAGRTFTGAFLAAVLRLPVSEVEDRLHATMARQIVVAGLEGYRFAHDKLREALYASVPATDRARLHLAAAQALELRQDAERRLEDDYAAIAHHFRQGGALERAVDYLEKAGEHALSMAANGDARRFFAEAIEIEVSLPQRLPAVRRARWERQMGDLLFGVGALVESAESLHRAAALLDRPLPRSSFGLAIKLTRELLRQVLHRCWPRRPRRGTEAEALALRESARVFDRLLQVAYYLGRENEAALAILTAVNLSELMPPDHALATIYASTAIMAGVLPAPGLAERYFALSEAALAQSPDTTAESWLRMEAGVYFLGRGDRDKAIEQLGRALELTTSLRYFRRMDETRSALANLDILAGHHHLAAKHLREMEEQSARRRDPQMLAWSLLLEMESAIMQGHDLPRSRLTQLHMLATDLAWPDRAWIASVEMYASWRSGNFHDALSLLDSALEWASHGRPVHLYCVGAYARLAEVSLDLFKRNPDDRRTQRAMRLAFRHLTRIARVFPIIQPALALHRGALYLALGKPHRARSTWLRAIPGARRMMLPYHRARLHASLADALPETSRAKALHRSIADDLARNTLAGATFPGGGAKAALPGEPENNDARYA